MSIPGLTNKGCIERRSQLIQSLDVDFVVISNPRNLYYYAGFLCPFPSLSEWGPVYLVIDVNDGGTTLIYHNRAAAAAQDSFVDRYEKWTWYDGRGTTSAEGEVFSMGSNVLGEFLSRKDSLSIGVEAGSFPAISGLKNAELIDISSFITGHRRSKYDDEISCIRYALDAALAGHEAAREEIRAGMTELDLFNVINAAITGKAGIPVKLIAEIISGPRTLNISGSPTDRIIEEDDTVILDLCPVVRGYRADYTATIVLGDSLAPRMLDLEKALHDAIEAGKKLLFPGSRAKDVYWAVKGCMNELGFGDKFPHHAGHGLGLDHPEPPFFVPGSDEQLVAGDVVALEPGSYAPGCTGRIEHVFLISNEGPVQLTHHNTRFSQK